MSGVNLRRILIEAAVEKAAGELKSDPKRGLRKLVDMAGQIAKGRFQKQAFEVMSSMLENENSGYYALLHSLACNTDIRHIKRFGINIGLNSWTEGARLIREREREYGYNIPWSVTISIADDGFASAHLERLIGEAVQEGIVTFFLVLGEVGMERLLGRLSRYPDCAFVLLVEPEAVTVEVADSLAQMLNCAASVNTKNGGYERAFALLRERGLVFAAHFVYTNAEDVGRICGGEWAEGIEGYSPVCAIALAGDMVDIEDCRAVSGYIDKMRREQGCALFFMDYFRDHFHIDSIISEDSCYVGIRSDGGIATSGSYSEVVTGYNVESTSLHEFLRTQYRK